MAQTAKGQKYNRIPAHTRTLPSGKKIKIAAHARSNPSEKKAETLQ